MGNSDARSTRAIPLPRERGNGDLGKEAIAGNGGIYSGTPRGMAATGLWWFLKKANGQLDWNLLLFTINLVLVPAGYFAAYVAGALVAVKIFRTGMMVLGLAVLLFGRAIPFEERVGRHFPWRHAVIAAFLAINLLILPFGLQPYISLERVLTLAPFLIYLSTLASRIGVQYGHREGMVRIGTCILAAYSVPIALYYFRSPDLGRRNIYGDSSTGLLSNHLGWSSAVVFAGLLDARRRLWPAGGWKRWSWLIGLAAAGNLLLISGSRSGYLSVGIAVGVLILAARGISWKGRLAGGLVAGLALVYILASPDSALNARLSRTQRQLETSESRLESLKVASSYFETHPEYYLHGLGFELFSDAIIYHTGVRVMKTHNSYIELFFTTGVFSYAIFVFGLALPGLIGYISKDARRFSFAVPVLVIPFFENMVGGGQFLYYPWFLLMFFYLHSIGQGADKEYSNYIPVT
jgi:O-antigen ligase